MLTPAEKLSSFNYALRYRCIFPFLFSDISPLFKPSNASFFPFPNKKKYVRISREITTSKRRIFRSKKNAAKKSSDTSLKILWNLWHHKVQENSDLRENPKYFLSLWKLNHFCKLVTIANLFLKVSKVQSFALLQKWPIEVQRKCLGGEKLILNVTLSIG